jgi:hypothetical protein
MVELKIENIHMNIILNIHNDNNNKDNIGINKIMLNRITIITK